MSRLILPLFAIAGLMLCTAPASAQRYRVPSSYHPPVSKPIESNYSSSSPSYSSGGYHYSGTSYSSSDSESSSGVTFHLVCLIIMALAIAIRILCGIIGFFLWIGRSVAGS